MVVSGSSQHQLLFILTMDYISQFLCISNSIRFFIGHYEWYRYSALYYPPLEVIKFSNMRTRNFNNHSSKDIYDKIQITKTKYLNFLRKAINILTKEQSEAKIFYCLTEIIWLMKALQLCKLLISFNQESVFPRGQ